MPKCLNCGQITERTEDWACQWCGHPLLSKSYKKISKTYRQLKEKSQDAKKLDLIDEQESIQQNINVSVTPTYTPLPEPEVAPEPEPVPEPSISTEPERAPELKPPVSTESSDKSTDEPEIEVIPLPSKMPEEPTNTVIKSEPESEVIPLPAKMPEEEPESKPESETEPIAHINQKVETDLPTDAGLNITVEELLSAYAEDNLAANARFIDKRLTITGTVDKIEVKDYLDIYYISLNNTERNSLQTVRCIFGKKDMDELNKLLPGQMVTVSGKFDGSIIDFRMSDCTLVS